MKGIVKLIAVLCALMATLAACGGRTPASTQTPSTESPATQTLAAEAPAAVTEASAAEANGLAETAEAAIEGLVIPLSSLTEQPLFINWSQGGTDMQLIARMDDAGVPQLAYNTCQVCAGSPYAYFAYENGVLVCQNCGNRFALSSVGRASGGCNPMPVAEYENDGTQLIVPEEVLAQAAPSFKNWKVF